MAKKPKSRNLKIEDARALNIPESFCSVVYIAIEPLTCNICSGTIEPLELFFRSLDKLAKKPGIKYICCNKCLPAIKNNSCSLNTDLVSKLRIAIA